MLHKARVWAFQCAFLHSSNSPNSLERRFMYRSNMTYGRWRKPPLSGISSSVADRTGVVTVALLAMPRALKQRIPLLFPHTAHLPRVSTTTADSNLALCCVIKHNVANQDSPWNMTSCWPVLVGSCSGSCLSFSTSTFKFVITPHTNSDWSSIEHVTV